jgi:site-specific recombinase XerC
MFRRGLVPANPMLLIRTPKQAKRLPKAMSVDQVDKFAVATQQGTLHVGRGVLHTAARQIEACTGLNEGLAL